MNVIEMKNVSKSYGGFWDKKTILDEINLSVKAGEFVNLQGNNGAGKSTLINLILGLQTPDKGKIKVFGFDPKNPQSRLLAGCMLQRGRVPDHLKVKELINLVRSYYTTSFSTEELLERSNLKHRRYNRANQLSGGEERSLYFALAIAGNPDLLILDEPTNDLSDTARAKFWQQVKDFNREGKTIIVITHQQSDQQEMIAQVTRVLKLEDGKISDVTIQENDQAFNQEKPEYPQYNRSRIVFFPALSALWGQFKVELLDLIRNPFFLISLFIIYCFTIFLDKNDPNVMSYFTAIAAFNLMLIAVEKFGVRIAAERTQGWTKLLRVTPLPPWIYLSAKILIALLISALGLGLMFGLGIFSVGIEQTPQQWAVLFFSLILGTLPFAVIGCATGYLFDTKSISLVSTLVFGLALLTTIPFTKIPWLDQSMAFSPFYHYGQLELWASGSQKLLGKNFYDGQLGLHIAWLISTGAIAAVIAKWAYQRDRSLG